MHEYVCCLMDSATPHFVRMCVLIISLDQGVSSMAGKNYNESELKPKLSAAQLLAAENIALGRFEASAPANNPEDRQAEVTLNMGSGVRKLTTYGKNDGCEANRGCIKTLRFILDNAEALQERLDEFVEGINAAPGTPGHIEVKYWAPKR